MRVRSQDRTSGAPLLLLLALCGGTASCTSASEAPGGDQPHTSNALDASDEWFVDRAATAGIDFVHFNGMSGRFYQPEIKGARRGYGMGVATGYVDNDGGSTSI